MGSDHFDGAVSLPGFAQLFRDRGHYARAEFLFPCAIQIWVRAVVLQSQFQGEKRGRWLERPNSIEEVNEPQEPLYELCGTVLLDFDQHPMVSPLLSLVSIYQNQSWHTLAKSFSKCALIILTSPLRPTSARDQGRDTTAAFPLLSSPLNASGNELSLPTFPPSRVPAQTAPCFSVPCGAQAGRDVLTSTQRGISSDAATERWPHSGNAPTVDTRHTLREKSSADACKHLRFSEPSGQTWRAKRQEMGSETERHTVGGRRDQATPVQGDSHSGGYAWEAAGVSTGPGS